MEKNVHIPPITIDPVVMFFEDERPEEFRVYNAQRDAVKEIWDNLIESKNETFRAAQFIQPGEYGQTILLTPSTREGVDWQLSFIDKDGIPAMHEDYIFNENSPLYINQKNKDALLSRLTDFSLHNREISVRVMYDEREQERRKGNMEYVLMHKNTPVIQFSLSKYTSEIIKVSDSFNTNHLPVGVSVKNNKVNRKELNDWWMGRSIPTSRSGIRNILESLQLSSTQELVTKSMALSLSDHYWFKPEGRDDIQWENINFFENSFSEDIGDVLFNGRVEKRNFDFNSPDNTSDGWLKKRWKIIDGERCLIKGGTPPNMYEPFNEVISSKIMDRLKVPHVEYNIMWEKGVPYSVCKDFITVDTEFVSANRISKTLKKNNHTSYYQHLKNCSESLGIGNITYQLDQMFVVDYIIANADRHLNNFGFIRDVDTLEWKGFAPIYDSGSSLGYNRVTAKILDRESYESRPFKKTHDEQIKLVSDLSWIDFTKLNNIEEIVNECLAGAEDYVSENRKQAIISLLNKRIERLQEIAKQRELQREQEINMAGNTYEKPENQIETSDFSFFDAFASNFVEAETKTNDLVENFSNDDILITDNNPRLFVDMDGTLARFHDEVQYLERMGEEGFFENLKPFENVVEGVKLFIQEFPACEVYALSSAISSPYCVEEKNKWLDKYLPEIPAEMRIFPPVGSVKADYVQQITGRPISDKDFLLDDYTKNLLEWKDGKGIKLVNNINRTNGVWKGETIRYDIPKVMFAKQLFDIVYDNPEREIGELDRFTEKPKLNIRQVENTENFEIIENTPYGSQDFTVTDPMINEVESLLNDITKSENEITESVPDFVIAEANPEDSKGFVVTEEMQKEVEVFIKEVSEPQPHEIPIDFSSFTVEQIDVIEGAKYEGLTNEQLSVIANPELSPEQMAYGKYGFKYGLSVEEVKFYLKPEFSPEQMDDVLYAFAKGLSFEQAQNFALPEYAHDRAGALIDLVNDYDYLMGELDYLLSVKTEIEGNKPIIPFGSEHKAWKEELNKCNSDLNLLEKKMKLRGNDIAEYGLDVSAFANTKQLEKRLYVRCSELIKEDYESLSPSRAQSLGERIKDINSSREQSKFMPMSEYNKKIEKMNEQNIINKQNQPEHEYKKSSDREK